MVWWFHMFICQKSQMSETFVQTFLLFMVSVCYDKMKMCGFFQHWYTLCQGDLLICPKLKNVHDHLLKNLFCLFSGNELLTIASSQWAGAFLTGGWFWQQSLRLAGNLEVGRGHQRWMRCFHSLSFSRCSIYRGKYTFLWLGPDHVTKWDFPFQKMQLPLKNPGS